MIDHELLFSIMISEQLRDDKRMSDILRHHGAQVSRSREDIPWKSLLFLPGAMFAAIGSNRIAALTAEAFSTTAFASLLPLI